jgi:hypothetical protein
LNFLLFSLSNQIRFSLFLDYFFEIITQSNSFNIFIISKFLMINLTNGKIYSIKMLLWICSREIPEVFPSFRLIFLIFQNPKMKNLESFIWRFCYLNAYEWFYYHRINSDRNDEENANFTQSKNFKFFLIRL